MKNLILVSAFIASTALGMGCTKKMGERAPNDAPTPPPSSIPSTPAPNEMPGSPDSTNTIPGDTAPMGEGTLPKDTTPPAP